MFWKKFRKMHYKMKIIEMNLNIGIIFKVPKDSNEHLFRMFLRQFVKYAWFNIAIPNKISIFIKKMFDYIEKTIENKMVMETKISLEVENMIY